MASPSEARDLILSSDYTIDKVIYKHQFSQSIPHAVSLSDSVFITIPHNLPFAPLMIGVFSDDNFATSYEFGSGPYFYNTGAMLWSDRIAAVVESDSTNVYVTAINFDTTRTFYFRLIGLPPTDLSGDPTVDSTDRASGLLFNTDDNYLKILDQNTITHVDDGSVGYTQLTVGHSLGYIPTGLVWSEFGGKIRQISAENYVGVAGVDNLAYFDQTNLYILTDPFSPMTIKFHYKIYLDS
jgi:hypothetical protein